MVHEAKSKQSPGGAAASSGNSISPEMKQMFSWPGGAHPVSVIALQKLSSLLLPHASLKSSCPLLRGVTQPIMPVNDIILEEARAKYARGERFNRCKLASCHRLFYIFGYANNISGHLTCRVLKGSDEFLVTPYGMLYNEVSAATLIKVDINGNILDQGKTHLSVHPLAWSLHAALYRQRPDVRCVLHLRTPQVIAVSVYKSGLLPASNDAVLCTHGAGVAVYLLDELLEPRAPATATATAEQVETTARAESDAGATGAGSSEAETAAIAAGAQAEAEGEAARAEEAESGIEKGESDVHMEHSRVDSTGSPVRSEPPPETDEQRATRIYEEKLKRYNEVANELKSSSAKVVLVRGHGALVMGETLEEAVYYVRKVHEACVAQLGLGRAADACAMEAESARALVEHEMSLSRDVIRGLTQSDAPEHWRLGEFEFENYMRYLDEAGYRTGHVFRLPVSRLDQPRERRFDEGIEIPPTTSTLTYYTEPGEEDKRPKEMPTGVEWVITPSQYEREVLDEGGILFPKKYTKWNLQKEDGPGTVVARMENPHSFLDKPAAGEQPASTASPAPRNQVKVHQQEVKQMYYRDIKTAGPLSRILDDRVIEHAVKVKDDVLTGKGQGTIIIGHASNGIIQREFQHTGETFQTYYGPNPFHGETEDELRDYMRGMKVQLPSDINFLKPSILEQKPEPPPVAPKPASVPVTPAHASQPAATSTPTAAQQQKQPAGLTATVEGQTLPAAQKAAVGVVLSETTRSNESSGSASTSPKASATASASTLPPGSQAPGFVSVPSGEASKSGTLDAKALKKMQKEKEKAEKAEKERKKKEEKERAKREKAAAKAK